jgi:hypothetical protein
MLFKPSVLTSQKAHTASAFLLVKIEGLKKELMVVDKAQPMLLKSSILTSHYPLLRTLLAPSYPARILKA